MLNVESFIVLFIVQAFIVHRTSLGHVIVYIHFYATYVAMYCPSRQFWYQQSTFGRLCSPLQHYGGAPNMKI